jgi:trimethylamine-N-oxide reductase cytochrome c-type subunit TorC
MIKFLENLFEKLDRGLTPREKTILVSILLIICIIGIVLAIRYYTYIQKNPEFCSSCHLMEEAYTAWKLSGHRYIVCQDCHQLGIIEQNSLLIKFVFTTDRKTPEPHGLATPWTTCTKCHWDEASQGAIHITKSTGHARHISVEKLECRDCHQRTVHSFRPDRNACLRCHKDWKIHGMGMEDVSCMTCHPFAAKKPGGFIPDRERCLSCHRSSTRTSFPAKVPMARLNCYECHRPHTRLKPVDEDCLRCHTREVLIIKGVHRSGGRCTTCHRPHRWIAQ